MATKANPGKYDCYANAEPDEPLFVLMGRDPHAPTLVWLWSILRELSGEDPAKVQEARECVVAMIEYATLKRGKRVHGLGESVLAGVMELIRGANYGVEKAMANNEPMTAENVRLFLSKTALEEPAPIAVWISVNGRQVSVMSGKSDYFQVIAWAGYGEERILSVTCQPVDRKLAGFIVSPGQEFEIKGGEIFSVADTGSA